MLVQRTSRESEAKRKQAEKEANHESRLREKEERARQVREHAQVQEANKRERERLEVEKKAAGTRRGCRAAGRESMEAATPPTTAPQVSSTAPSVQATTIAQPQHMHAIPAEQGAAAFNGTLPSQFLWPGSTSGNPMSQTPNSPFYYNQFLLPHLFPSGS